MKYHSSLCFRSRSKNLNENLLYLISSVQLPNVRLFEKVGHISVPSRKQRSSANRLTNAIRAGIPDLSPAPEVIKEGASRTHHQSPGH